MSNERYLFAEKSRSSIKIGSVRVFDDEHTLGEYVESLFEKARERATRGHCFFYPSCWFIWLVSDSGEPVLSKKMMIAMNLRGSEGETLSKQAKLDLGIN